MPNSVLKLSWNPTRLKTTGQKRGPVLVGGSWFQGEGINDYDATKCLIPFAAANKVLEV